MSRNGSGTYNLPAGNPVVTGTTITTTWANTTLSDIASSLTGSVAADGQTPMSGSLNMANNKVISVLDPTNAQDAATKNYTDTAIAVVTGGLGTMSAQNANAVAITGGTETGVSIDNSPIGSTTRSTVKATTLDLGLSTQSVAIGQGNASAMKNRIINGAMVIDQRNAGASQTPTAGAYVVDRWYYNPSQASKMSIQQNAGSVATPAGFTNYAGATTVSAYSITATDYFVLQQKIEGYNIADLGWGTANAKTVTLSFQVYSSLTGTFGGALQNSAANRNYPFTYSVPVANTWTTISVTIAGDTSGTWLTTNGIGINLIFGLGVGSTYSGTAGAWSGTYYISATGATSVVGTSGATFYITGVQLEVGSSATGFEYVNYQTSLANCQRYYSKFGSGTALYCVFGSGLAGSSTVGNFFLKHAQTMRSSPTITQSNCGIGYNASLTPITSTTSTYSGTDTSLIQFAQTGTTFTVGIALLLEGNGTSAAYIDFSSEL